MGEVLLGIRASDEVVGPIPVLVSRPRWQKGLGGTWKSIRRNGKIGKRKDDSSGLGANPARTGQQRAEPKEC